jgi:type II secretory pathway pseudopilin PulG
MKSFLLKKFYKNNKIAFSLLELSIVITIAAILVTGAMAVSINKVNNAKVSQTKSNIEKIYKALGSYLRANGKLPCPAPITVLKSDTANYGVAATTCTSATTGIYATTGNSKLFYGMVPVKTLNLNLDMAEDGFGSKLAYVVNSDFTNATNFGASTSLSNLITVQDVTNSGVDKVITSEAIFAIINYGPNKSGAFNVNSSSQNTASSDANELKNTISGSNLPSSILVNSVGGSDVFDDKIFYKTRNGIVSDFDALYLIPCEPTASHYNDVYLDPGVGGNTTLATWPQAKYGQVVAATGPANTGPLGAGYNGYCKSGYTATVNRPTKKCGAFGDWEAGAISSCSKDGTGTGGGSSGGGGTLLCSGGTESTNGSKKVHQFTSSGTLSCSGSGNIEYLVVGGGGGGGGVVTGDGGGGGGGGGVVVYGTVTSFSAASTTVTVGGYGAGGSGASGSAGGTSSLGAIASAAGGGGGHVGGNNDGVGGSSGAKSGGAKQTCDNGHGAGGGGASSVNNGGNAQTTQHGDHYAGAGAAGTTSTITGTSVVYGSGGGGCGGGGGSEGTVGAAGTGSGGHGGGGAYTGHGSPGTGDTIAPAVGVANKGGGGGGGGKNNAGAHGGKGVVIVSY